MRALVTGATGFVGGRLATALAGERVEVRALVRDRARASDLEGAGIELHEGDVTRAETQRGLPHAALPGPAAAGDDRAGLAEDADPADRDRRRDRLPGRGAGPSPPRPAARSRSGVARPLVEGLATETVVTDRSGMELFDIEPIGFDESLRRALAEDPEAAPR